MYLLFFGDAIFFMFVKRLKSEASSRSISQEDQQDRGSVDALEIGP
jgi:hypothetical protein